MILVGDDIMYARTLLTRSIVADKTRGHVLWMHDKEQVSSFAHNGYIHILDYLRNRI